MKVTKKIIFIISLFLVNNIYINAAVCDKENINIIKNQASEVSIKYEKDEEYINSQGEKEKGIYKIKISGLKEDMSVRIKSLNINEKYTDENKGDITLSGIESGIKKISIYFDICNELLITNTLNIPIFNKYSEREECNGITDLDVCKEDYQYELNESIFQKKLKDYKELKEQENNSKKKENKITETFNVVIEFLKSYYLYIISAILIVVFVTIYILIRKKRYTLE